MTVARSRGNLRAPVGVVRLCVPWGLAAVVVAKLRARPRADPVAFPIDSVDDRPLHDANSPRPIAVDRQCRDMAGTVVPIMARPYRPAGLIPAG